MTQEYVNLITDLIMLKRTYYSQYAELFDKAFKAMEVDEQLIENIENAIDRYKEVHNHESF